MDSAAHMVQAGFVKLHHDMLAVSAHPFVFGASIGIHDGDIMRYVIGVGEANGISHLDREESGTKCRSL